MLESAIEIPAKVTKECYLASGGSEHHVGWKIIGTDLSLHAHVNSTYNNAFAIAELIRAAETAPIARASLWLNIQEHPAIDGGLISLRIDGSRQIQLGPWFHNVTIYLEPKKVKAEIDISCLGGPYERVTERFTGTQKQQEIRGEKMDFRFEQTVTHAKTGSFKTSSGWTSGVTGGISVKGNIGYTPPSADGGVGGGVEAGVSLGWSHQITESTSTSHRVSFEEKRNLTIEDSIPFREGNVVMEITAKEVIWWNAKVRVLQENNECIEEHDTTFTVMQYSSEIKCLD